ncbi:MAG: 3',5'-cyclic-nucleotide phosphodiesterase [Sulfuricella sp.]
MKLKVLGCSGGIGGNLRTTSFLLDQDVLIDAGTGMMDLTVSELMLIDHIFITHSHLDHIAGIPLLVDTVGWMRDKPITLHATEETLNILKQHIFNWLIWPDFNLIPTSDQPLMVYAPFSIGETIALGGRKITSLPANHVVPAVGFQLDSGQHSLVFSGDTTTNDALWAEVNKIENLSHLIIETSFSNKELDLAVASKHLVPSLLVEELKKLKKPAHIYITHLKPGEIELIICEVERDAENFKPRMLQNQQIFEF